ncbi:SIT4 phosphatase-associated protein-domain-containing protein [Gilbertella persicaria]|uniref:SIT4 phosphatase-associated protein-domain-containing protein n=1 Tax=Gilbertella persicaria TaxID=101096 RepID=UPI00222070AB|nr:SIT4 phosphatase-associated protein-domain-containing protein [Gilbertella persicaria]KAI8064312.1 SIT4 phosphatase-associated protein-domain-containing protein [Gilbertella persicaria]
MFWRFGFNSSTLDTLLDKEDVTFEEVLEEEDLLQEAKSMNPKLVEFLSKPEHIKALLNYITATDLEENKRFKYPFLASEIIACEIQPIIDAIVIDHKDLLVQFWSYLDRPAQPRRRANDTTDTSGEEQVVGLDSLQASYFCKTIGVLLSKYPIEMMTFIQSNPENLNKILSHLQTSAIMDLLLTLVRMEELPEGKGVVKWLSDHKLLGNLIDRLDPYLDVEEHSIAQQCICEIIRMSQTSLPESPSIGLNELIVELKSELTMQKLAKYMLDPDAPNATSTLINGVSIIIDIIRHNNSDLENDPAVAALYEYQQQQQQQQQQQSFQRAGVSLADMLKVMGDHVSEFTHLLLKPRSVRGPIRTTLGEMEPLGFERLKICELFAELLHCSNMSNLNHFNVAADDEEEEEGKEEKESGLSVGDYLKSKFVENKAMPICVDLFFAFPWNNFLHYVIYDMLHQVFNGRMDIGLNRHLAISILKDGQLTDKIIIAQKANDEACAKPKGMRAGYMGHLTFISDEIMKLFEGYPETIVLEIKDDIDMEGWNAYCNNELKETKDRDQLPLGGLRPNDDVDVPQSDEEDDEDALEGTAASQYSRFLAQRGEEGQFDEEDEEDADHWITYVTHSHKKKLTFPSGRDDFNRDYNYNNNNYTKNEMAEDGEEDEYNSNDEEENDNHITPDWTRNFSKFSQPTSLRRTSSHTANNNDEDDDEYDDGDDFDHLADAEELERRAALRRAGYKVTEEGEQEEDDEFGDFESAADNESEQKQWELSSQMENLDVNKKPTTLAVVQDEYLVRAIKTKEEEYLKQKKEYQHDADEQEGEI